MTTSWVIIALAMIVTKMMTMMTLMMTGKNKKKTSGKLKKTQARHVFSVFQRLTTFIFTKLHFNAMQREERGLKTQIVDLKMYIYIFNLVLVRILVFILMLATIGRSWMIIHSLI